MISMTTKISLPPNYSTITMELAVRARLVLSKTMSVVLVSLGTRRLQESEFFLDPSLT